MTTVTTSITGSILAALVRDDREFDEVALAVGIAPEVLRDPGARVPYDKHAAVWGEVARRSGNPYVGLLAASAISVNQLGVVARAVSRCSTLGQAFDQFLRYQRLLNDAVGTDYEVDGDEIHVVMDLKISPWTLPRPEAEFALGLVWSSIRFVLGEKVNPTETRFKHAQPPDLEDYFPIFGDALSFGARTNELIFPRSMLSRPCREGDPKSRELLEEESTRMLESLPAADPLVETVRQVVLELMSTGELSMQSVSREMGTSAAVLRRDLAARDTSLRSIVNAMKRDMATAYLEDRTWLLADVAFVLGFTDTASFNRTFRGWTGETPAEYRRGFFEGQ